MRHIAYSKMIRKGVKTVTDYRFAVKTAFMINFGGQGTS